MPKLRIEIETARPLRGLDVGRIIERLIVAFEQFEARDHVSRDERADLRVTAAYTGSLILELTALALSGASVAFSFEQCRDRMVRFVQCLKGSAESLKGPIVGAVRGTDEEFIASAMTPLLSGDAILIVVLVHGDNGEPFALDRRGAEQIRDATMPRERAKTAKDRISIERDQRPEHETEAAPRVEWREGDLSPAQVYFTDRWLALASSVGASLPIVNDRIMSGRDWNHVYEATGRVLHSQHGDAYRIAQVGASHPARK